MKITKIGNLLLWRVLTAVFLFLLVVGIAGSVVTTEWSGYINKYLNISNTKIVETGETTVDPYYYKSEYDTHTEVMQAARNVAYRAQAEGTVLMTNKNNALPLAKNSKVTFFSYSTADIAYGGTGSGGVTASEDRETDLLKACTNDGKLQLNTELYNYYLGQIEAGNQASNGALTRKTSAGWGAPAAYQVPEISPEDFPSNVTSSYDNYKDAAVFVLTRVGGEGNDLITTSATEDVTSQTHYLELTDKEKAVLQEMKDGPFAKRIVLINAFNTPELGWLDEYDIDACLYIGGPGEVGMDAVTDILVGEVNPSGKLADTYATDDFSSPAMQNFGDFTYVNATSIVGHDGSFSNATKYLMYNEGIYVGYRYYETRYADCVNDVAGANSKTGAFASTDGWNYSEEVEFSFGYGMSYTTFEQTLDRVEVDWANKKATVTVTVKNTGDRDGKDVVQVYVQAPYTAGGIEKSAVQLVAFDKTDMLTKKTGEQTLDIEVDLRDFASYDYENYGTYIMEKGKYYFAIGNGAHDALNNILAKQGKTVSDGMDYDGDADKAYESEKTTFDENEYSFSVANDKYKIKNQFEKTDINYYDDSVKYLSRSNWSGTWPANMSDYTASAELLEDINGYYDATGNYEPAHYTPGTDTIDITYGSTATKYNIVMMMGASYDDEAWDVLLDQITLDEMIQFSRQGRTEILSVNLNATTAVDGPAAWTKSKYKTDWKDVSADEIEVTEESMVLYPTETVFAGTWNVELLYEIGVSFGEEGLWGGGVGWYGPGANTHRTPFAGRNFEYYSEDGFIAGKLAEAEVKGAMSKGVIPYIKHFFLNDQETNRIGVCTFSNEQAIREIYLRAFQYAFETTGEDDPSCTGVMGGFNRLGATWTGHHSNLWKNVMEGEFGFTGNVTTDFGQNPAGLMNPQLAYEAGTTMFCTSSATTFVNVIKDKVTKDSKLAYTLREATKRNLYNFTKSMAMNGMTSTSKIVRVMTWYEIAFTVWIVISAVGTAASVLMMTIHIINKNKEVTVK